MLRVQPAVPVASTSRRDVAQSARTPSRPKSVSRLPVPAPAPAPVGLSPSPASTSYVLSSPPARSWLSGAYPGTRTTRDIAPCNASQSPRRLAPSVHLPHTRPAPHANPPTTSLTSVSQLRDALSTLDSKVAALLNERARLEASLEQAVRLQAPIRRLPSELLASIITMSVSGPDRDEPPVLSNVMLVCHRWAAIVRETPALWSQITISPQHSLNRAKVRLARSKSAPLDIAIVFDTRRDPLSARIPWNEVITLALDLLVPHMWRWRSFNLAVPQSAQVHRALARCISPAPSLSSLHVRIFNTLQEEESDSSLPLALLAGLAPRLRECTLYSVSIDWNMRVIRLAGLRVLDIGGYWSDVPPSVAEILDVLRACPELEELALRQMADISLDSDAHDPFAYEAHCGTRIPAHIIALPRLRKAIFNYSGIQRTREVLSQLAFPALEEIELCYLEDASLILPHLDRQALTSLPLRRLYIEQSFCPEKGLLKLLARIPSLMTLELVDVEVVSSFLLKSLTIPTTHSWICPNLETLILDGSTKLPFDALRSFVEARLSPHLRAYPRAVPPSSATAYRSPTCAYYLSFDNESMRPSRSSRPPLTSCRSHSTPPHDTGDALAWPQRLQCLGLARCHQFSREMLQWLRMYVPDVRLDDVREPPLA
ncbi:hypothetical protein K488DRAFT_52904 [Vararia minispora EC-137]|uniref:Uncharacterized protein n=1 Tax=Vararia minispora EC-137 TaxID=1314806 RepID=A0ACB8QIB7_9AGAM|nr:hypothetical protein K488DRAFT_52904 [Vararia minispora EC-137]